VLRVTLTLMYSPVLSKQQYGAPWWMSNLDLSTMKMPIHVCLSIILLLLLSLAPMDMFGSEEFWMSTELL